MGRKTNNGTLTKLYGKKGVEKIKDKFNLKTHYDETSSWMVNADRDISGILYDAERDNLTLEEFIVKLYNVKLNKLEDQINQLNSHYFKNYLVVSE